MEHTLGQQLTGLREAQGLTQEDLAEKAGVSRPQISRLENDEVEAPRKSTLEKIAKALEVDPKALFATAEVRHRQHRFLGTHVQAQVSAPASGVTPELYAVVKNENEFLKQENARLWEMLGKSSSSLGAAWASLLAKAGLGFSDVLAA
jgi:transcriptional regulator with XRE-family HTH domain